MLQSMTNSERGLLDLLLQVPPNMETAEAYLTEIQLTPAEVTRVGIEYADACFCDTEDADISDVPDAQNTGIVPNLHSTYLYNTVALLLRYGLEPNGVYEGQNIMHLMQFIDNEYVAADTLRLLLENGADPYLRVDGELVFLNIDFDLIFDTIEMYCRPRYAATVHCWMVMVGFGAGGEMDYVETFEEFDPTERCFLGKFDLAKLKDHRNYYFGVSHIDGKRTVSIYDKRTLWEVVRII